MRTKEEKLAQRRAYGRRADVVAKRRAYDKARYLKPGRLEAQYRRAALPENRAKALAWKRRAYKKDPEGHKARAKTFRESGKGRAYILRYAVSPERKFSTYQHGAAQRGLVFGLTIKEFKTFWGRPCSYCGASIPTIGLDRVDSSAGYTVSNVVSSCWVCNEMKMARSKAAFIEQCRRIVAIADLEGLL